MDVSATERRSGIDPIFGLERPVLFAHRGGAGEVPENTEEAFRHAVENGSDVLELDIQLTRDGEIVVWYGLPWTASTMGETPSRRKSRSRISAGRGISRVAPGWSISGTRTTGSRERIACF